MTLAADNLIVMRRARAVLDGVSVEIKRGEIVAVVGPNGAGKSTLLKALAGLIPLAGGRATLDARDVAGWDKRALAREVAYLPQERIVHWPLKSRAIVALGRLPHRPGGAGESASDTVAIDNALAMLDAGAFAERPVTELSGGEQARVLVARAIAQDARFIVADEPTAGLDPAHALGLFGHFRRLAAEGRGVVVALHDLSLAARFCHRVLLLKGGKALATGVPGEVLTPELLASGYGIRATLQSIAGVPVVLAIEPLA